jgi:TonB family protein
LDRQVQRQGFLVSALVHLVALMVLIARPAPDPARKGLSEASPSALTQGPRLFLPPPEELRRLALQPRTPTPRPTPPPAAANKDRINVGPPSAERGPGPMILRRDDDLTATPKGTPDARGAEARPPVPSLVPPATAPGADGAREAAQRPGLKLPPGLGPLLRGDEGSRKGEAARRPSLVASARDYLEGRLPDGGARGLPSGTGRQMGPLFFDPEGADFTLWINHFKNEVYRNWIVPQSALLGFKGEVDLVFVVARDGTLADLELARSSGTAALDRSARNALQGSRLLPLPTDYGPKEITMRVRFIYG